MRDETRRRRRLARATPVEDWLRTAAVKDRIAGFLRAARPLSVWLDTNVGRQPPEAEPGKPGVLALDAHA
jgi:hypothetical protein